MENVASYLQYGGSPRIGQCESALRSYQPTEAEIKEREAIEKKHRARDLALCTISTAEKLMISGLDVDAAFTKAEQLVEKSQLYLAQKTELN